MTQCPFCRHVCSSDKCILILGQETLGKDNLILQTYDYVLCSCFHWYALSLGVPTQVANTRE